MTNEIINKRLKECYDIHGVSMSDKFLPYIQLIIQDSIQEMTKNVNRLEVINHAKDGQGREYVKYPKQVELSLQNDLRTLKVFIK